MSCSLTLKGSGYLKCKNETYMYVKDQEIYDVVIHPKGRIELKHIEVPKLVTPIKYENLTASEILLKLSNISNDIVTKAEEALTEYVSFCFVHDFFELTMFS